jgi:hypothetical protein
LGVATLWYDTKETGHLILFSSSKRPHSHEAIVLTNMMKMKTCIRRQGTNGDTTGAMGKWMIFGYPLLAIV